MEPCRNGYLQLAAYVSLPKPYMFQVIECKISLLFTYKQALYSCHSFEFKFLLYSSPFPQPYGIVGPRWHIST